MMRPYYQRVRREEFGLDDDQEFRPPTGTSATSRYPRRTPAELAILRWHNDVQHRLVSHSTGLPFRTIHLLLPVTREHCRFVEASTTSTGSGGSRACNKISMPQGYPRKPVPRPRKEIL